MSNYCKIIALVSLLSICSGIACIPRFEPDASVADHRSNLQTEATDRTSNSGRFDQSKSNAIAPGVGDSPLSSVIAVYPLDKGEKFLSMVKGRLARCKQSGFDNCGLPLSAKPSAPFERDQVRVMEGLAGNVLVSWLDEINPQGDYFGTNNDYLAYFGDDWRGHGAPQWNGDAGAGFLWVNHEYLSPSDLDEPGFPRVKHAPRGQYLLLAKHLAGVNQLPAGDVTRNDYWTQTRVNLLVRQAKQNLGGSWIRIVRNQTGRWRIDPDTGANQRYTADASTRFKMTGPFVENLLSKDKIIPGTLANCSGGTTPWGTILTAEENNRLFYGDPEPAFATEGLVNSGLGVDAGGVIMPDYSPRPGHHFTASSDRQPGIENYGWATEIDPGIASSKSYDPVDGSGHAKHSALGQARWENFTFVVDPSWKLVDGKPLVVYYADDRRGGRVFKFVSHNRFHKGMPKREIRNLLTSGSVYVSQLDDVSISDGYSILSTGKAPTRSGAHLGRWIEMSIDNDSDIAPNHGIVGQFVARDKNGDRHRVSYNNAAKTRVGAALRDRFWNGLGGFDTQATVLANLFTAATKIGVFEQNRPEDVEWNPMDKTLYVAYTYHGKKVWLNQQGGLANSPKKRADEVGRIWAFREFDPNNPADSLKFQFWEVAAGDPYFCDDPDSLAFARPDNIAIDKTGDLWFSTDGQYSLSDGICPDAVYYLDMDSLRGAGNAVRILTVPNGAEATGPALNSNMSTLFLSVQHPGEGTASSWPTRN